MALSNSPRKVVPLARGDEQKLPLSSSSGPGVTRRVFFCGVVVEGSDNGRRLPEEVQDLVMSLGEPLDSDPETSMLSPSPDPTETDRTTHRKRALTDSSALSAVINELVSTERSYVKRLRTLKYDYADPLRKFSRSKDTAILPPYEAKTLFGNIDNLLPVNEAFLTDLEKMMAPNSAKSIGGVGDVALRHFKDLRGFEHYKQYYVKREEAQAIFEREMTKKSSGFAAFIDHIKYSSADTRNRVGLRELLMDPVQRIPRYTLMFRTMIKHMAPGDPQKAKLIEADDIASKIALAEADEQTKRAAVMYCLNSTVDGFPPGLISNSRRYIDCVDVEDVLTDGPLASSASGSGSSAGSLHCSLFLFDDKLVIVKRPGNGEKGGKVLTGLDELDRVTKSGALPSGKKKSGMTCKGVVDVVDVVATDVGGADIHLYLENPPQDQSDRWSGRPFRSLAVVYPPLPINLDPTRTEADKHRFLENLWNVQAKYRSKAGQSVVLRAEDQEVESRGGRVTFARTYFNIYQRTAFLQEAKKTKIVIHIDAMGSADPIPFGINAAPFVIVRVQPMAGELSRYTVTSSDPDDEAEEDIVQTGRVPSRIVQTIHQYGLFKFQTGKNSLPSTPTPNTRSRAAIFGLDALSRNLFNTRPGSSVGDFFGGSINGHRRVKSTASRSSMYTQSTTTGDSSLTKFSHRSNSTATAATTVSTRDDESFFAAKSPPKPRKLQRSKSPGGSAPNTDRSSPRRNLTRSRSVSRERELVYSDVEDDNGTILANFEKLDPSELDLAMQLELARRNSKNQHGQAIAPLTVEKPVEKTIYEEDPPHPVRPASRASRDSNSHRSATPTRASHSRSTSQHSSEHRPLGPRSPSPLPRPKSPHMHVSTVEPLEIDSALETVVHSPQLPATPLPRRGLPTPIPRSKRQPFHPTGNTDTTPKLAVNGSAVPNTEPLSIKKKTSVRTTLMNATPGSPTSARKTLTRNSPLSRTSRVNSPKHISSQVRGTRATSTHHSPKHENVERIVQLAQTTREDVESSHRAIKRIKLEIHGLHSSSLQDSEDEQSRPSSPDKGFRTPQRSNPASNRAAQERMEEMRQLIGQRQGEGTPRGRPQSTVNHTPSRGSSLAGPARSLELLTSQAENDLARAVSSHGTLQDDLQRLSTDFKERSADLEKTRIELQNAKRQCELVKSLLADATAEKEIMYEAFNEELDGMYNDANLPDDEAWTALSSDLRRTKEARNVLSKENSQLKRRIAEIEMQQEEWGALLRAHGLIP